MSKTYFLSDSSICRTPYCNKFRRILVSQKHLGPVFDRDRCTIVVQFMFIIQAVRLEPVDAMLQWHVMSDALPVDIDGGRVVAGFIDSNGVRLNPLYRGIVIEPKLDLVIQPITWERTARLGPKKFGYAKQPYYIVNGIADRKWSETSRAEPFLNRDGNFERHGLYLDNEPDQRGPGVEHPFVKTDHRSSIESDGYLAFSVQDRRQSMTFTLHRATIQHRHSSIQCGPQYRERCVPGRLAESSPAQCQAMAAPFHRSDRTF